MRRFVSLVLLCVMALGTAWGQYDKLSDAQLLETWNADQQANKGYVWTINIHSGTSINLEGLMEANYALHVSMSHVGPTMNGVYSGELNLSANRDTKGFEALLAAMGGTLKTNSNKADVASDRYLMVMKAYSAADAQAWEAAFGAEAMYQGMSGYQRNMVKDVVDGMLESYVPRMKGYETSTTPVSRGQAFGLPESSMGAYQSAQIDIRNGYGHFAAGGSTDIGAKDAQAEYQRAWSRVTTFMGGTLHRSYNQKKYAPVPHTITVYPNNAVVFELYSSDGGPVTAKFYGTIDRVPVGSTVQVTQNTIKNAAQTQPTDETMEQQRKAANAVIAARKAKRAAAEAAELEQQRAAEAAEAQAESNEVLSQWKTALAMYPMWQGGRDLAMELYDTNPLTCLFTYHSDTDLWPAYVARLRAAGFKAMVRNQDLGFYKVVDGKYYSVEIDTYNGVEYDDMGHDLIIREMDASGIARVKENGEK